MNKVIRRITVSGIYFAAVVGCYLLNLTTVLSILSLPWSYPLLLFSGLILHVAANGEEQIALGKVAGAVLNVLLYLLWCLRSNADSSDGINSK